MKNEVYILLGGNIGNRENLFRKAILELESRVGGIEKFSGLYESEAWGFHSQGKFLNQVIMILTELSPWQLLIELKKIETKLGRKTAAGNDYTDRNIDLDILFFNQLIMETKDLTVPHPKLHLRKFTLKPLAEIAEGIIHPILNVTVAELLENCNDQVEVYDYLPVKEREQITHEV